MSMTFKWIAFEKILKSRPYCIVQGTDSVLKFTFSVLTNLMRICWCHAKVLTLCSISSNNEDISFILEHDSFLKAMQQGQVIINSFTTE